MKYFIAVNKHRKLVSSQEEFTDLINSDSEHDICANGPDFKQQCPHSSNFQAILSCSQTSTSVSMN